MIFYLNEKINLKSEDILNYRAKTMTPSSKILIMLIYQLALAIFICKIIKV